MRRTYWARLVFNGVWINEIVIDPHYELKHDDHMNDHLIVDLVHSLHLKIADPDQKSMKYVRKKTTSMNWPPEEEVAKMRKLLSSPKTMGSSSLPENPTPTQRIKYELCKQVVSYSLNPAISRRALAKRLKIDEPELSRLLHYKISRFTIDRLVKYISILYPKISIQLKVA